MLIQTADQCDDFLTAARREQYIVLDTETDGLNAFDGDKVVGLAVYLPNAGQAYYLPRAHGLSNSPGYHNLSDSPFKLFWRECSYKKFIYYNATFDMHMMKQSMGFEASMGIEDVMLAAHLMNENERLSNSKHTKNKKGYAPLTKGAYTLKRLSDKYLGDESSGDEAELFAVAKELGLDAKKDIWKMPLDIVAKYAEMDVILTWNLRQFYIPHLENWGLFETYQSRCRFLRNVVYEMEKNGIHVDENLIVEHLEGIEIDADTMVKDMSEEAKRYAINPKDGFNPRSPKQVLSLLQRRGHKILSTASDILEPIREKDKFVDTLLRYRSLMKAERTYYNPYLNMQTEDGRIHPSFNVIGTVAGRMSCYRPNLQQIPRAGEYKVKEVFVPREGYCFVEADYSMLELRLAAHYCQEKVLIKMLEDGTDVHQFTADSLGVDRFKGKTANFSFLYGMGPVTGALRLGVSEKEAKRIITGWRKLFPGLREGYINMQEEAQRQRTNKGKRFQFIRLPNGRLRRYNEFKAYPYWRDRKERNGPPYYTAFNSLIQGAASNVMDTALFNISKQYRNSDLLKMLLTVHDSVILEVRADCIYSVIPSVIDLMENAVKISVPLLVEAKVGKHNLYDMREYVLNT